MASILMEILDEISNQDFNKFLKLIDENPDLLNAPTSANGQTMLHIAATYNNLEVAKFLVDKGLRVNDADRDSGVPLHSAAENNAYEVAKWLLENGANVDGVDLESSTPLVAAIVSDDFEMVKLLREHGARLDLTFTKNKNDIKDVMSFAEIYGNQDIINYLKG